MAVTPVKVLTTIARSLVHTCQYRDVDEALRRLAEEDDWMAWRSVLSLLADWKRAYRELQGAPSRS